MIQYVVAALLATPRVGRVIVVGPEAELALLYESEPRVLVTGGGETAIASVQEGLKILQTKGKVLIVTSDIPLLTPDAVDDFLDACKAKEADLYYPIVPREENEKKYPGVERTYVYLKDGVFTGGNMFLVEAEMISDRAQIATELVKLRKKPAAMCRLIGWGFIVKFFFRRLSLAEVEQKGSALLRLRGKAVISPFPEVGIDVDKPSDLDLVRQSLAKLA